MRRRTTPAGATVEPLDERSCVLLSGAETLHGLAFHLGLLGWDFEVLEPPELRDLVAELGGRFARAGVVGSP